MTHTTHDLLERLETVRSYYTPETRSEIAIADAITRIRELEAENMRLREIRAIEGMPRDRSFHGLRYAAGSRLDEAGCTVSQIESVLGHRTFRMALKYASQRLRSKAAIAKIEA